MVEKQRLQTEYISKSLNLESLEDIGVKLNIRPRRSIVQFYSFFVNEFTMKSNKYIRNTQYNLMKIGVYVYLLYIPKLIIY